MHLRARVCAVILVGLVAGLGMVATSARAQEADFIPDEVVKKKKKDDKKKKKPPKQGWIPTLKVGFSFAFAQSQGVVGVPDGLTLALSLQLDGGLVFRRGPHEWVSQLRILHTQSKIPSIEPFIKAADQFELSTLYQYRLPPLPWLGFFGGVRVQTPLFPGNLVRDADTELLLTRTDDTQWNDTALAQKPYRLTGAFAPLLFKQFAGALFKPLERPWLDVDIRLGLGAVEAWTQSGYVVKDDEATPELDLTQLEDYAQGGVELQVALKGTAVKKILTYALSVEVMYPFATSIETELSGAELFNTEFRFTLGIKVYKWLAINYALSVLRVPLIVDEWQVTNSLMVSLTANIVK